MPQLVVIFNPGVSAGAAQTFLQDVFEKFGLAVEVSVAEVTEEDRHAVHGYLESGVAAQMLRFDLNIDVIE